MAVDHASSWLPNQTVEVPSHADAFKPYDHQTAAWDAISKHFLDNKAPAGILVVPTGGGKTAIAARWLLQHVIQGGGRVMWFAHRRSLLRQACKTFAKAAHLVAPKEHLKLITISSEDCRWSNVTPEHDVVFSSVQSATIEANLGFLDLMKQQSPKGLFVVVDEAHHAAAPGYLRVLGMLKELGAPLLGLTATPVRMNEVDERRLWNVFQKIIYHIDKKTLFNHEILAQPHIETVRTEVNFEREFTPDDVTYLSKFGELAPRVLERLAKHSARNALIADHYVQHKDKYGPTIVFGGDTLHAQTLAEEFKKRGVDADYVDYSRKDAQMVMHAYAERGTPTVLANVEMLTEGFDAPRTRTVFIARPTRSESLLAQMVGRALRGPRAGGNQNAYLVTFLDTWEQFDVLDAEYVVNGGPTEPVETKQRPYSPLLAISEELIREAYRLVQSNVRGAFVGIHQCLPYAWYIWEEEFADDIQKRLVLIFENQRAGFEAFDADYAAVDKIPAEVSEDLARSLVRRYFSDCHDPLPRWMDLKSILDARRKGCVVSKYTFEDKKKFDPAALAKSFHERDLGARTQESELQAVWEQNEPCKLVYRGDFKAFVEDVNRELLNLLDNKQPPPEPKLKDLVPTKTPRRWDSTDQSYSLTELRDDVVAQQRHFPRGAPMVKELAYSRKSLRNLWGFFRYSDRALTINCHLNSPDVPRFVMEFLLYHELLHADMPAAGHNRDFRARERMFTPSEKAIADATARGIVPGAARDAWRVMADQFLDTFQQYYVDRDPSESMGM